MVTYAFVMDDVLGTAKIVFHDSENDPPTRWHYFETVKEANALLIVDALNKQNEES